VGAASEFFGFDDHAQGAGLDIIEAPPGVPDGAVAVIVRGDSGYPAIRDGMVLIYWNTDGDPAGLVGEDCFVKLRDGRTLVKILERGTQPGRWTLSSINASTPPIRDVEIEWAAPIEVRLRRMNWKQGG
jgi:phage repressor protein C with HTH and peptisase S24 domain